MGMQSHALLHPSLQVAKRKTQRRIQSGLVLWVGLVPAGCTRAVLKARWWRKKIHCPLLGSWDSRQSSLGLRFGQSAGYFSSPLRDI